MKKKIKDLAEIFIAALTMGAGFVAGLYIVTAIARLF